MTMSETLETFFLVIGVWFTVSLVATGIYIFIMTRR